MIYQGLSLAPHLSVMENIALGVEPTRWGLVRRDEIRRRATEALAAARARRHPARTPSSVDLSPAGAAARRDRARARLRVPRARARRADEQPRPRRRASGCSIVIARLKAQGLAIVYISHFLEEVKAVSDRFVVLRDGRNAGDGRPPRPDAGDDREPHGRPRVDELYPRSGRATPGRRMLEVDAPGARVGDASPCIAARCSASPAWSAPDARACCARSSGSSRSGPAAIRLGAYSGPATPDARWRQGMGLVSEDRAGEGLAAGAQRRRQPHAVEARPASGRGSSCCRRAQDAAARRWIDRLGIRCAGPRQPVAALSGGNQQKVARRAAAAPRRRRARARRADARHRRREQGADLRARRRTGRAVRRRARPPKAVLLVSSYLPELLGVCDRIAVMSRGRLGDAAAGRRVDRARARSWPRRERSRPHESRARLLDERGVLIGLLLVSALFAALLGPQFLRGANLELMARQAVIVCVAAFGMTMVIAAGGIDLSVGSIVALSTVVTAQLLRTPPGRSVAVLGAVARGACCGAVNGVLDHHAPRRAVHRHARHDAGRSRGGEGTGRRAPRRGADDVAERAAEDRRRRPRLARAVGRLADGDPGAARRA